MKICKSQLESVILLLGAVYSGFSESSISSGSYLLSSIDRVTLTLACHTDLQITARFCNSVVCACAQM